MTDDNFKHILFCVAGMSPAVITETLFGLYKQNVKNGEIHVLTTVRGAEGIKSTLVGDIGKIAQFNQDYNTKWRIKMEWIEVVADRDGVLLDDLRTTDDNMAVANQIMQKVRKWTERDEIILHASLAGGRKTMGFYLGQAMSWFSRPKDDLSHVLVPPELEQNRDFFYPAPNDLELQKKIDYAPQTFVRLQGFMPDQLVKDEDLTYEEAARLFQAFLSDKFGEGELMLDLAEHTLSLDGVEVLVFAPLQMALYLFMCENSNTARGQEPIDMLRDAFQYRDKIAECLQRCDVRNRKAEGLSALILPETEWPEHWLKEGNNMSFSDSRNKNLGSALSRINKGNRLAPPHNIKPA